MNTDNQRKTLTVTESAFEACDSLKDEGESWSEFFHRVAETLETDGQQAEHGVNIPDDVLTERHLDDIAQYTARQLTEELRAQQSRL